MRNSHGVVHIFEQIRSKAIVFDFTCRQWDYEGLRSCIQVDTLETHIHISLYRLPNEWTTIHCAMEWNISICHVKRLVVIWRWEQHWKICFWNSYSLSRSLEIYKRIPCKLWVSSFWKKSRSNAFEWGWTVFPACCWWMKNGISYGVVYTALEH